MVPHNLEKFINQQLIKNNGVRKIQGLKVRDVMTKNPITISPEDTVGHTLNIFEQSEVFSIPVLNKEEIVGIITKQDITTKMCTKSTTRQEEISYIMSKNPLTISPDEELINALNIIKKTKIPAIIVAENTKLVGILTINDIIRQYPTKSTKTV